ncbi:PKD domain-containing protein [Tateyamaria omphalii]|uniref:PKD domain-containing protein n=1 Tax=Tateyamaria omphalii TaxID=299262 RepID=UPI0034A0D14A
MTLRTALTGAESGLKQLETRRQISVNAAARAVIKAPDMVAAGQAIVFDAAASTDSDGALTQFAWDFGDGTTAMGVVAAHVFTAPGDYTVRLTVTDDAAVGNSDVTATTRVTVNPPPTVGLAVAGQMCPAVAQDWSVNAARGTSVSWTFGDGTTAEGARTTHGFAKPGLSPVSVALDDGRGLLNSSWREEVYVRVNAAPRAVAGPDQVVNPGDTVSFSAAQSGDIDGVLTDYRWSFGDCITLADVHVTRRFDQSGPVAVKLTVRDDSGAACDTGQDNLTVLVNTAPQIDAGPNRTTPVGAAHDVLVIDASGASDADGHSVTVDWDFGDGTTATGAILRHAYAAPGAYTVTFTARDSTGLPSGITSDTAIVIATPRGE